MKNSITFSSTMDGEQTFEEFINTSDHWLRPKFEREAVGVADDPILIMDFYKREYRYYREFFRGA